MNVKVQKGNTIKEIPKEWLPMYLTSGWKEPEKETKKK
jgi:hypothetical protein